MNTTTVKQLAAQRDYKRECLALRLRLLLCCSKLNF